MAKKKFVWHEPKKTPKLAIDLIIEKGSSIILSKRNIYPFQGKHTLIGGFVNYNETVEKAAIREAKEETGLKVKLKHILGVYSSKNRDPRFQTITTVFVASPVEGKLKGNYEGKVAWVNISKIDLKNMGFDHGKIVRDYLKWRKVKGTYWSTR